MRTPKVALSTLLCLAPWGSALAADPNAQEQFMVYEINRARSDPFAYAVEMAYPQDVVDDLAIVAPSQPLAINPNLIDSTRVHASDMASNTYCQHFSTFLNKWPNLVARDAGYPLPMQLPNPDDPQFFFVLPDDNNQIESIACGFGPGAMDFSQALNALNALIIDEGVVPPGHRIQLLALDVFNTLWREVGAGFGNNPTPGPNNFRNYWAIHTGVIDTEQSFLTGVVYADGNGNGLYDLDEGLAGVTVSADGANTLSNAEGGYAIPIADGSYTPSCTGGPFAGTATASLQVAGLNRAVDCISGNPDAIVDFNVPEPGSLALGLSALAALGALARTRRVG